MATKKKLLQAAAGNAGGAGLNVEDVFSTYLYEGNATARSITNGIDLDGEGGLVWIKNRESGSYNNNFLSDTENGANNFLATNQTNGLRTLSGFGLTAFNSDGFDMGTAYGNESGIDIASWTFRKAPRFFDVVTYTGDGNNNRQISHNLGTTVGCMIVKRTDTTKNWRVYHRAADASPEEGYLTLNSTAAWFDELANGYSQNQSTWWYTAPTSTDFTVGSSVDVNASGGTYVAYLFAHNDGDGEFGPDADQDIIKCGSYAGNNSTDGPEIDLGFEPQWIMIKTATSSQSWWMHDTMRGIVTSPNGSDDARLKANASTAEDTNNHLHVTPTGFKITSSLSGVNESADYIYMAIRRGPMAVPESATDVFGISYAQNVNAVPFPVDFMLYKIYGGGNTYARDRLRGGTKYLLTETTNADLTGSDIGFDDMTGNTAVWGTSFIHYNWKRAPNFCDVVAYTGNGTTSRYVNHNLEVIPELVIIKRRSSTGNWWVDHDGAGAGKVIYLDRANAAFSYTAFGTHTSTQIQLETAANNDTNNSGSTYIAYLFASLAGISKVGSVTHSGTTNVDCGFSSGARFVLLKRTDATGDWYVWDSERGIVSGNDPYFLLNSTAAEVTNTDYIDPLSSGFTITSSFTAGDYIFYAIA
jgi:hypothetical protein